MVNNKAIRQAIYTKLNVAAVTTLLANGSASIYHAIAPESAGYPLLIFAKQGGVTTNAMGASAFKAQSWLVKGVARDGSSSAAEDVDKAVDDLLSFGRIAIAGADDMFLARETDVEYTQPVGEVLFRHCGGVYRLIVQ